ncbi:MAG: 50S ribosomal protein L3 [Gammaproteobacteria bacterium]|nr:MAG: 50S ribosomal protein L3 [Gammaproteobacteria bacterium]
MKMGLVGYKEGMTRVFKEDGSAVPVTVIRVPDNTVVSHKTMEKDGYTAVQVTYGSQKPSRLSKAEIGHFAKNKVEVGAGLSEFRVDEADLSNYEVGSVVPMSLFAAGSKVDVRGVSIGKGFAGGVKRHNFSMQRATHGNSLSHRVLGSIGQNQTPGRVFKGKKMAGRMGGVNKCIQNLEVIEVNEEKGYILVKGGIPGHKNARVFINASVKS